MSSLTFTIGVLDGKAHIVEKYMKNYPVKIYKGGDYY